MTGADDERQAALRIGGWLPPADPPVEQVDEPEATELIPVVRGAQPDGRRPQPTALITRLTPREEPTTRGPSGQGNSLRSRRVALGGAAAAAAAAAVPLVIGLVAGRSGPDRTVQPPPALLATAASATPEVGTPISAGPTPTISPSASRSATSAPTPSTVGGPVAGARPALPPPASTPGRAVHLSIEAEAPTTVRGGEASIRAMAGASGGAVVGRIGNGSANLVRFTGVAVPAADTYTVTVHYVSDERRRAAVTVGGQREATVNFPGTGNWDTVGTVSVRLPLAAGPNTIEFGNRNAWAPDLDRIVITR